MRQLFVVSTALATTLLCAACDLEPRVTTDLARETWSRGERQARQKIADLRARQLALAERMNELRAAAGADDAQIAAALAGVQQQVAAVEAAVAAAETAFSQNVERVELALGRANKAEARRAVESGIARIEAAIESASAAVAAPEPQIAAQQQALTRDLDTLAREKQRVRRIAFEGGSVVLDDLVFKTDDVVDTGAGPGRAALDLALALASVCDSLELTIAAHTSGFTDPEDDRSVSKARAKAMKQFFVDSGVPAAKIAKLEALGRTRPLIPEPKPESAEARALAPAERAARQHKNDRIELVVTKPCVPDPADAAPPAPTTEPVPPPTGVVVPAQRPARSRAAVEGNPPLRGQLIRPSDN